MGSKELTWLGRQLQSITDGEDEIAYTYNGDGLRTSKTVNGTTTEYYYNGSILAGQKSGNDTLVFMYDNNSDIFGFVYNGTEYYYIKNAQNDVIAIADADGNVLVKYEYDAWGKIAKITKADGSDITNLEDDIFHHTADFITGEQHPVLDENGNPVTSASTEVTLARINPILYRSYYYDRETGWYYLKTRYYSPDMCRFINADGYIQTGQGLLDKNMFAYCMNNSINRIVPYGTFGLTATSIIAAFLAAVEALLAYMIKIAVIALVTTAVAGTIKLTSEIIKKAASHSKSKAKTTTRRKAKDSDPRIHHMVAQYAWRAAPAREILEKVNINPKTAPENLITISHGLHKSMQTKKYYEYVNAKLQTCIINEETGEVDQAAVEKALLEIRADIEYAEATGIKRWDFE